DLGPAAADPSRRVERKPDTVQPRTQRSGGLADLELDHARRRAGAQCRSESASTHDRVSQRLPADDVSHAPRVAAAPAVAPAEPRSKVTRRVAARSAAGTTSRLNAVLRGATT